MSTDKMLNAIHKMPYSVRMVFSSVINIECMIQNLFHGFYDKMSISMSVYTQLRCKLTYCSCCREKNYHQPFASSLAFWALGIIWLRYFVEYCVSWDRFISMKCSMSVYIKASDVNRHTASEQWHNPKIRYFHVPCGAMRNVKCSAHHFKQYIFSIFVLSAEFWQYVGFTALKRKLVLCGRVFRRCRPKPIYKLRLCTFLVIRTQNSPRKMYCVL